MANIYQASKHQLVGRRQCKCEKAFFDNSAPYWLWPVPSRSLIQSWIWKSQYLFTFFLLQDVVGKRASDWLDERANDAHFSFSTRYFVRFYLSPTSITGWAGFSSFCQAFASFYSTHALCNWNLIRFFLVAKRDLPLVTSSQRRMFVDGKRYCIKLPPLLNRANERKWEGANERKTTHCSFSLQLNISFLCQSSTSFHLLQTWLEKHALGAKSCHLLEFWELIFHIWQLGMWGMIDQTGGLEFYFASR